MALLWLCFVVANSILKFGSNTRYVLSVAAVIIGALWFSATLLTYQPSSLSNSHYLFGNIALVEKYLNNILAAASIAYLTVLAAPTYKLFTSWKGVQQLKSSGVKKPDIRLRLYSRRVASLLGLKREVGVYLSDLVKSPVTIGYLKPVILLPIALVNYLTIEQTEAVLLHELSHIKRNDYLINLILCITGTLLYFNPFVRLFIRSAAEERENCCDQLVLQFGYDKFIYASALVNLEKLSASSNTLAMAAAGKKNLLARIERIVGIEKKPAFRLAHLTAFVAAFLGIMFTNSLLVNGDAAARNGTPVAFHHVVNPFNFLASEDAVEDKVVAAVGTRKNVQPAILSGQPVDIVASVEEYLEQVSPTPAFVNVALHENGPTLSAAEAEKVRKAIETTKKVLANSQWKEIEKSIADVMTSDEKEQVKREYLKELNDVDWTRLEQNLNANYHRLDWNKIESSLDGALISLQIETVHQSYLEVLRQIEMVQDSNSPGCIAESPVLPFPDKSATEIENIKVEILQQLKSLDSLGSKKDVKL